MPADTQEQQDYQDYLAYQDYVKKAGNQPAAPEEEGLRGGRVRGIMDLIRPGFSDGEVQGAVKGGTLGNVNIDDKAADPMGRAVGQGAAMATIGAGAGGVVAAVPSAMGRIGAQAAMSGAQGALQKPEGEDSLSARAQNGGISAFLGGLLQTGGEGIAKLLGGASTISNNIKDVKSGEMANRAASAIDEAAGGIDKNQIAPRDAKLRELVRGKEYSVNPDRVKPVFPNLGNKMEANLPTAELPKTFSNDAGTFTANVAQPTEAQTAISGPRALRLKRAADSAAQWGGSKPFDPSASARGEDAEALANVIRRQMNADPEVAAVNEGLQDNLNLKRSLVSREGTSPIETLTAPQGSSRGSVVDLADTAGGSDLRSLGKEIKTAKGLVLDPSKALQVSHPLDALTEVGRTGARSAVEAASLADALRQASPVSKEALINMRLQRQGGQ